MRSLSLSPGGAAELVEAPVPQPESSEALVRVGVSAICGSEMHAHGDPNPGHEAAGVIESAPATSDFKPGDLVGISAVSGCGICRQCRRGVSLYCESGFRVQTGMHAEFVATPVSALRRLPAGTSAHDAVLISGDALGVPARALRRAPTKASDRVLIIGLGPVGLGHTVVRAHVGAHVVAIEPSNYRRDLGRALGAIAALVPGEDTGEPPSLVIECTGIPACIQFALETVATGGTVLQSGECPAVQINPSETLIRREITYTGAWYYAEEDFGAMLDLIGAGLPISKLATHAFAADNIDQAYRTFASTESGKVLIEWH